MWWLVNSLLGKTENENGTGLISDICFKGTVHVNTSVMSKSVIPNPHFRLFLKYKKVIFNETGDISVPTLEVLGTKTLMH